MPTFLIWRVYMGESFHLKTNGDSGGDLCSAWQIVILEDRDIHDSLLEIGAGIHKKHKAVLEKIKAPYSRAVLERVPEHLRKAAEYELQLVFHSDAGSCSTAWTAC